MNLRLNILISIILIIGSGLAFAESTDTTKADPIIELTTKIFALDVNEEGVKVYTLDEVFKTALAYSDKVRMSEEDLYIFQKSVDKVVGGLFPTASLFGSYGSGVSSSSYGTKAWGARLDKTLNLGGYDMFSFKAADYSVKQYKAALEATKESYLLTVTDAYIAILKAKRTLQAARDNVERLKKYKEAAEIRLKVGEAIKTDVYSADSQLASAIAIMIQAKNGVEMAKSTLARWVGIKEHYDIADIIAVENPNDSNESVTQKSLDELRNLAMSNRNEVIMAEMAQKSLEQGVKIAESAYWPTVTFSLVYTYGSLSPQPAAFYNSGGLAPLLSVTFPIFSGGTTRMAVSQAKASVRKQELQVADLQKSLALEIEGYYIQYKNQQDVIKADGAAHVAAQANYDLVLKQYQYGLANSLNVIDGNNTLVNTIVKEISDKYDFQSFIIHMKGSAGQLLKEVTAR